MSEREDTPIGTAFELKGVYKSFDGIPALEGAFLSAEWGEIHALLGENGAGKSSLMNIAYGLYKADRGTMQIEGQSTTVDGPHGARLLGIGMVHQHFTLVRNFTVAENIMLASGHGSWRRSLNHIRARIAEISEQLGFHVDPDRRIDSISVAEQQRVEIIKVLIGGARILILDEPTAVLTDEEAEGLLNQLRVFAEKGNCVVMITHKLREVFSHADRVTVMRAGQTVESGRAPADLTERELSELMVGATEIEERTYAAVKGDLKLDLKKLEVRRESGAPALSGLNLSLFGGQIYGLAGVGGNGQTELAEILMGVRRTEKGRISLHGQELLAPTPRKLRRAGVACVPSDRYIYGISGDLSVMDNFIVSHIDRREYGIPIWINRKAILRDTLNAIASFSIQGARPATRARLLSGGNAQKLVLAREMIGHFSILLAHSPTRGLDVRACADVHRLLREACKKGAAVLLMSEDLDEILTYSDRIGVINRGRIVGEFDGHADRQEVGRLMVGHG